MGIGIPFENLSGTGRPLMLGINRRFVFEMTGIRIAVEIDSSGDQHPAVLSLLDPVWETVRWCTAATGQDKKKEDQILG